MKIRRFQTLVVVFACVAWHAALSPGSSAELPGRNRVVVDYFYEAGCSDCARVRNQVLPELSERFEGFFRIYSHDVGVKSNVILLAAYQARLGVMTNSSVMMVVDYRHVFSGFDAIKAGLLNQIDESVAERQEPGWTPPQPVSAGNDSEDLVQERLRSFAVSVVMTAGFLDGLNPCAIASLVFLMSMLAVAKVKGRGLLVMGTFFCLASFSAYTALGFGLLRTLHLFSGFPIIKQAVDVVMMIMLVILGVLSFRDAVKYRKSGDSGDVVLQLPDGIKQRIHRIIRNIVGRRRRQNADQAGAEGRPDEQLQRGDLSCEGGMGSLAVGGAVIGFLVTALESVCTGQMYVPTLVVVLKSGKSSATAAMYLLLYNIMFILPLVAVFILTYFGLKTNALIAWSKRNVVTSKVFLGVFFLGLAVLVWVL